MPIFNAANPAVGRISCKKMLVCFRPSERKRKEGKKEKKKERGKEREEMRKKIPQDRVGGHRAQCTKEFLPDS